VIGLAYRVPSRLVERHPHVRRLRRPVALFVPLVLALTACQPSAGYQPIDLLSHSPVTDKGNRPVATFIGDSYSTGFGAVTGNYRWTYLVSQHFGWLEDNEARTGTGFLASDRTVPGLACETSECAPVGAAITNLSDTSPDLVVIAAGINDVGLATGEAQLFEDAVRAAFDEACGVFPASRIVVVSPFGRIAFPTDEQRAQSTLVVSLATEHGFITIDGADTWLAQRADLMTPDAGHPNNAGHALIAQRVISALERASFDVEGQCARIGESLAPSGDLGG
jgi:lysophospholipase L1-like esterase